MLTDYFVADAADAELIANSYELAAELSTKNADNIVLAGLWLAINGSTDAERLEGDDFIVAQGGADGPWVFDIPNDFISALVNLPESEAAEVCQKWAKSEEMVIQEVSAQDLVQPLKQLQDVASLANNSGKRLFLRISM